MSTTAKGRFASQSPRLLTATPKAILGYSPDQLLDAIRMSEGRTVVAVARVRGPNACDGVSNMELCAGFGTDIIALGLYNPYEPYFPGLPNLVEDKTEDATLAKVQMDLGRGWKLTEVRELIGRPVAAAMYGTDQSFPDRMEASFVRLPGSVGPLRMQVIWLAALVLLLIYARHKTRWGLWVQAVGSNGRAARMMGVPTKTVRVSVFVLSGVLCSLAGIIEVAHSNQAVPQSGDSVMLTALAGAIVGGVAMTGGKGDVLGPLLGGLTLRLISMGLVMMGVIKYWTDLLTAVALIVTAYAFYLLDSLRTKKVTL